MYVCATGALIFKPDYRTIAYETRFLTTLGKAACRQLEQFAMG